MNKTRKLFVLSAFLIIIFLVNAASAGENVTDGNLTVQNTNEPLETVQDEINVTFDEQMWQENLTDIDVELPKSASGRFAVKIDDEVIYNQTITDKSFKVPLKLPKSKYDFYILSIYPPIDYRAYKVTAYYNGIDLNLNKTLRVMKNSPDFNYLGNFPEEIIHNDNQYSLRYAVMFPHSANGYAEIYLDDKLFNRTKVDGPYLQLDTSKITSMSLGDHTIKVIYYNDTYYSPINRTFNFTIVDVAIDIPEIVNINHDDCISVNTLKDMDARVRVYIDGALVCNEKYEKYFVFSLADHVKSTSGEVKVEFTSKTLSRTKTQKIQVTYDFDIYQMSEMIYGEDKEIEIDLPNKLNNKLLTVTINGTKYKFKRLDDDMGNVIVVDISKLHAGNYQMFISYSGDARFAPKNKTFNFTIDYSIFTPDFIEFKDGSKVYLNLPSTAKGILEVYIDGKLYKSVKMEKGKANIKLDRLNPGEYELYVEYDGRDFNVNSQETIIHVSPKIKIDTYFRLGKKTSVTMEVSKKCKGTMVVTIDGKKHKIKISNGKASYSLKKLKIGEHEVKVEFKGKNGYECYDYYFVEVIPAKTKIKAKNVNVLYNHKFKYRIKLLGTKAQPLKNKWVKVKIAKKTYKVKTNKKGVATVKLSGLKLKTYKVKITYKRVKATKKIGVKLLKVKAKRTSSGVKLEAKLFRALKSQKVTFKFDKKKYSARTDSKGVAKITVKNFRKGKTIKYWASYQKSTVKGSIKIKK